MSEAEIQAIATSRAPAAIGPYSQAVRWGNLVFCSGQIGLDPATGKLVEGGAAGQARQCLENLKAVIEEAGASLAHALKVTVYLTDLAFYGQVNEVYAEFFPGETPPARAAVEVAGLPKGALVEIDLIAAG